MKIKISDFKGLLRKSTIKLIRKQQFKDNQSVFEFNAGDTKWRPGEHGIFTMPDKKIEGKKWRAFSVASTPEERVVRIATKITDTPSSFKEHLKNLEIGDEITVRGPFGWFYRKDQQTPIVMVALGVGITPIMAMVREQAQNPTDATMYIIYSTPVEHLFKDMLDDATKKNPKIIVSYVNSSKEVEGLLDQQLATHRDNAYYYISGAPKAVKALKEKIKGAGVSGRHIVYDSYLGYE